jgi:hypothetical protein
MAEGKSSFLLYRDLKFTLDNLSDEKAGQLFKHILDYVNDLNPNTEDIVIKVAFEPIKQSLKRDLKKWESICERNRINGSKRIKNNPSEPSGFFGNPSEPKKADSDTDSDSDTDNDNEESKKKKRKSTHKKFKPPTIEEVKQYFRENNYQESLAIKFFKSYDVANWVDSKGNKIQNWKQKAIQVWFKDEGKISTGTNTKLA